MKKAEKAPRSPIIFVVIIVAVALVFAGLASWSVTQQAIKKVPVQSCANAKMLIQKGEYSSDTQTLRIYVYNYGSVDLTFNAIVSYSDNRFVVDEKLYSVNSGEIKQVLISNIQSDTFKEVTVQADECQNAQDLLKAEYISGF